MTEPARPLPPLVELSGLGKSYREGADVHVVLDGIDGRFERGEFVVLFGRSGSGKSTLLNLIGGLDQPTAGDILVGGESLVRLDERARTLWRRRHVGFVFQSYNLVPTLTTLENVLLPLELNGVSGRAATGRARALLAEVGLADRGGSFPEQLSGGEQQRVAIARALAHGPDLILADEPTGNLDLETARQVLGLLDRLTRAAGKTMVMATHSTEVIGLADRILRLQDGRLVSDGAGDVDGAALAPRRQPS